MVKTRKRMPELTKAQLGNSIVWVFSRMSVYGDRSDRVGLVMAGLRSCGSDSLGCQCFGARERGSEGGFVPGVAGMVEARLS